MPTPPTPDTAVPPELAALAEYTDLRPLGQGGMGVVYAGTQVLMNRPVVLKVMTPAAEGGEAATERFLREIRAAAALDHPNVVKAYAAHRAGPRLVFVMEYVAGDDLAKVVEARGPLPVANAAYFVYQAALGLQHAHDRGLVHRDIKPGNLLVAKAFGKTVVKVADFGLAKAVRERELSHGLTGDGRLMGTPHFLAPEQALDAARADIRADIYSLGCTLYHLLAGRPPFDGGSLIALVDAHRSATAPPLDRLRPEVPAGLAAAVARMMAKNPADRPQTPGEAARDLVPFFKPGGTAATPVHTHLPADPPPRAAVATAIPLDTPPAPAAAASHWKPPTVFRGQSVPHDTAYLNAEDFNPPAKPPKPPRKKKAKSPVAVGPLVGVGVAVAAVIVGGLVALVGLRDKPAAGEVTPPTALTPPDPAPVPPAPPTPPPADGFVSLFNGRDTSDWAVVPGTADNWVVENGSLVGRGGSKASHLFCNRYYSDFHLRVEYRINAAGNSGVYFRATQSAGEIYPDGYEAQINPTDRSGPPTGSLYLNSKVAATGGHVGVPGEWTTLEVIAAGASVTVKVNSVTTSTFTASAGHPTRGRLALQHHNPQTTVEFRRVELKELTAPSPPPPTPQPVPRGTATPATSRPAKGTLVSAAGGRRGIANHNRWFAGDGKECLRAEGKELVMTHTGPKSGWFYFGDPEWTDYDLSVRHKGTGGPCLFVRLNWVYTGRTNDAGLPTTEMAAGLFAYGWRNNTILSVEGYSHSTGFLTHEHVPGLPTAELPVVLDPNKWYTALVKVRGDTLETYLDGKPMLRGKPPMPSRGLVGLRLVDAGTTRFKEIKVTAPDGRVLCEGLPELPK